MSSATGPRDVGVALHTDVVGDVVERRSRGERAVLATRHAPYFLQYGVQIVCEHVVGDTFEALTFPLDRALTTMFPPRFYAPSYLKHNLINLDAFLDDIEESHELVTLVRTAADLDEAAGGGRLGVVLCFQGCSPVEDAHELLGLYWRLGVRILGVSSALVPNAAVGHANDGEDRGVTDFGKRLLAEAGRLGMIVDVSGCAERSFWGVFEHFGGSVLASTTNARAVYDRKSNFTDDQLRALGARAGVVGVIVNERSLGEGRVTIDDVVRHLERVTKTAGAQAAALGPNIVEPRMYPREDYERIYRDVGFWTGAYPPGLGSFQELHHLWERLTELGWPEESIAGVRGANAARFLRRALPATDVRV